MVCNGNRLGQELELALQVFVASGGASSARGADIIRHVLLDGERGAVTRAAEFYGVPKQTVSDLVLRFKQVCRSAWDRAGRDPAELLDAA